MCALRLLVEADPDGRYGRVFSSLVFPSITGDDLSDRGRAARGLLRQQSPGTVRRHGRVPRPAARPSAKPLPAPGQAADRIQGFR